MPENMGTWGPLYGWVKVRELSSTSTGVEWPPEGPAPEYGAAKEYVYLPGEERPPEPFSAGSFRELSAPLDKSLGGV